MANMFVVQIADQKVNGTLSPDCVKLSQMASTVSTAFGLKVGTKALLIFDILQAVDFSKTGIPMTEPMPRYPRVRPDYMAPSPRVNISSSGFLGFEDADEEEDDAFDGIDSEKSRMRYYMSNKALGFLFRDIDERQFVANMQQRQRAASNDLNSGRSTLMKSLLSYAKYLAIQWGVIYDHHTALARQIRQS